VSPSGRPSEPRRPTSAFGSPHLASGASPVHRTVRGERPFTPTPADPTRGEGVARARPVTPKNRPPVFPDHSQPTPCIGLQDGERLFTTLLPLGRLWKPALWRPVANLWQATQGLWRPSGDLWRPVPASPSDGVNAPPSGA
jgi:hypothetical protein